MLLGAEFGAEESSTLEPPVDPTIDVGALDIGVVTGVEIIPGESEKLDGRMERVDLTSVDDKGVNANDEAGRLEIDPEDGR